jgi:hypothetical protein
MTPEARMAALKTAMATALPTRVVTREFMDRALRPAEDLAAGVVSLISLGERDYQNLNDREAMDGTHRILLVGDLMLAEGSTGLAVEQAESALVEEVKAFLRALPADLCNLVATGWRQSGQIEAPFGWVIMDMEARA